MNILQMSDVEIDKQLKLEWGKGYSVKVRKVIRKKSIPLTVVIYRVKCHRDGASEIRCKGGSKVDRWDHVVSRSF